MNKMLLAFVLFAALVIIAFSSNPISDGINFVASASYSENNSATIQSLQASPRISSCDASAHQIILNELNGEINQETGAVDGLTIGEWLDSKMPAHACIAASK